MVLEKLVCEKVKRQLGISL